MSMYNLIEYSSHYSDTAAGVWFYSKDWAAAYNADIVTNDNFKSFNLLDFLWIYSARHIK